MTKFDDFLKTQNLNWDAWRSLPPAQKAHVGIDFQLSLNQRPHDSDLKDAGIPSNWDIKKIAQTRSAQKLKGRDRGLMEQKQEIEDAERRKRWLAIAKKNGVDPTPLPQGSATFKPMFKHTSDDWKIPPRR